MTRVERARRIRDLILREGGITLERSLSPRFFRMIVSKHWCAQIRRRRARLSGSAYTDASRLELWIGDEQVAIFNWTETEISVVRMRRGSWESDYFGLEPYRTSAERWIEICESSPVNLELLALVSKTEERVRQRSLFIDQAEGGEVRNSLAGRIDA